MDFRERLELFNRKVEILGQRSFIAHLVEHGSNVRIKWDRDVGWESAFLGPHDESIEASILTVRQFMQNNDPISIRNVADAYQHSGVDPEIIAEYQKVRGWLNDYLDRPSHISISEGSALTNRDLLEMFVYGGMGHSSEPHYSRYKGLINSPFGHLVRVMFVDVLGKFITGLHHLATVNLKVLDPQRKPQPDKTD